MTYKCIEITKNTQILKTADFAIFFLYMLYYFLTPECVRIPRVLAPKNFPVENFRVQSVLPRSLLFRQFPCPDGKNVAGSCALNFDATDLPHS